MKQTVTLWRGIKPIASVNDVRSVSPDSMSSESDLLAGSQGLTAVSPVKRAGVSEVRRENVNDIAIDQAFSPISHDTHVKFAKRIREAQKRICIIYEAWRMSEIVNQNDWDQMMELDANLEAKLAIIEGGSQMELAIAEWESSTIAVLKAARIKFAP